MKRSLQKGFTLIELMKGKRKSGLTLNGTLDHPQSGIAPDVYVGNALDKVFQDAISAHLGWLVRFQGALVGISREQFDPKQISDDRACEFGRCPDRSCRFESVVMNIMLPS